MKYTTKIICIIILAFAGVSGCLLVVQKGLRIYSNHSTERLTEILADTTNFQMIFIGSSRTHTSINPRIIDSILDINSYNAGVEGGNLFEFNMIFNAYVFIRFLFPAKPRDSHQR